MRFARHGSAGLERPVVSEGPHAPWRDLSSVTDDITPAFLGTLSGVDVAALPEVPELGRYGPPLTGIGKVVCIGLNYSDHARETGAEPPAEPVVFLKAATTVIGPDDDVLIPRLSVKTDWEVELAVVIGKKARYLPSVEAAADHIAGYTISNDVSEREWQLERGGQWDKGKNCETFNPLGPWLVTPDELAPQSLQLGLTVNGRVRQDGATADMLFGVYHLVWYLSQFMVLHPGDVINTGTPAGVALGMTGQPYLRPGDVVELKVEGLGRQRQTFRSA